jgi:hypothetical protein
MREVVDPARFEARPGRHGGVEGTALIRSKFLWSPKHGVATKRNHLIVAMAFLTVPPSSTPLLQLVKGPMGQPTAWTHGTPALFPALESVREHC